MRFFLYVAFLFFIVIPHLHAAPSEPVGTLPTLPKTYLEHRFKTIQEAFEQRANLFLKGRPFQPWYYKKSKTDMLSDFNQITEWRLHTWYVDPTAKVLISRQEFMIAQDILEKNLFRKPQYIAFQYNQTDGTYNSSTITLNGFTFLALEAPTTHTLSNFFMLLVNHRVTQLVRLDYSKETRALEIPAYWTNALRKNATASETIINVRLPYSPVPFKIGYFTFDIWQENQEIDPLKLLTLIQNVRKGSDPHGLIACHSTYGSGRTGTFIAGFILLNEIDRQIADGRAKDKLKISIEKIVMQLSLQRAYLVRTVEQYISLHRLVDLYIDSLRP
jgi:hypothetical protein